MKRISKKEKTARIIAFIIFTVYSVTLVFPLLWLLLNSFKQANDFSMNLWGLPSTWKFSNYVNVFSLTISKKSIVYMFLNSLFVATVGTLLSVFSSVLGSYVISKYRFIGRNAIYMIAVTVMLVPTIGATSATYGLLQKLGLYDNYFGIFFLYSGGFGFSFILLHGFFKNVSWSYAEAAFIDGCGDFGAFIRIMIPQAMPAVTSLLVLQWIGLWNDYFTVYMYMPDNPTLAVGLQSITNQLEYNADYPMLFSAMIVSVVPVILLFCAFQKTIMENTIAGGLKG